MGHEIIDPVRIDNVSLFKGSVTFIDSLAHFPQISLKKVVFFVFFTKKISQFSLVCAYCSYFSKMSKDLKAILNHLENGQRQRVRDSL